MQNTEPDTAEVRAQIARRLKDAELSPDRFVSLYSGQKRPDQEWRNENRSDKAVSGNYGIRCGDGLVVLDVDAHKPGVESPDELDELPPTLTTESCHGGSHIWFHVTGGEVKSTKPGWGDVQSEGRLVVGPSSEIHGTRDGKDCSYDDCCTVDNPGIYGFRSDYPIATVPIDRLTAIPGVEKVSDAPPAQTDTPTIQWKETANPTDIDAVPDDFNPDQITNEIGMTLLQVTNASYRLDRLLDRDERLNPENRYNTTSEADMNTAYLLYGWRFDPDDIIMILRACRDREGRDFEKPMKMRRDDYAPRTVVKAKERVDQQIAPEFAWALVGSASENDGHGPKASRRTLEVTQAGILEAFLWTGKTEMSTAEIAGTPSVVHDWPLPSTEWSEITDEARQKRVRRALHILANAGIVERRQLESGRYRWEYDGSEIVSNLMFQVDLSDKREEENAKTFGTGTIAVAN